MVCRRREAQHPASAFGITFSTRELEWRSIEAIRVGAEEKESEETEQGWKEVEGTEEETKVQAGRSHEDVGEGILGD